MQQVRQDVAAVLRQVAEAKPEDDVIPSEPPPAAPSRFAAAVATSVAAAEPDAGYVPQARDEGFARRSRVFCALHFEITVVVLLTDPVIGPRPFARVVRLVA